MENLIKCFIIITICILPVKTFAQDNSLDSNSVNQDKFFDSNSVKIFYTDEGSGETVILIHGFSNSHREWEWSGIPTKLAEKYRVISIDVRGHGKSGKPHDPNAYGKELGEDVIRLLDYLEIPKAHIMGYSMGAMINGYLLTNHPDRFLTAIFGGGVGWHEITPRMIEGNEQIVKRYEDPAMAQQYADRNMDPIALAMLGRSLMRIPWDKEKMAKVKIPVLAIRGSEDGGGVEGLKDFHKILPSAKLVEIEGATHAGPKGAMGRPEFIEAVQEFLAEHSQ